ncbi:MAG: hypothetical protein ACK5IQ_00450 [Bacteroidales bacterium]
MVITYLVFGTDNSNYGQAIFSILSFLSQTNDNDKVAVVSDHPEKFSFLSDRIIVIGINEEKLTEWKGKYQFFWRVKIKTLQLVTSKYENHSILYLDSDTFLFGSLDRIKSCLDEGINLMHTNEGKLSKLASKTERKMWSQVKNRDYAGITIDPDTCMWNAGVVAVSHKNIDKLDLALDICDSMCAEKVTPRLIEQFAFSVAMGAGVRLIAAENEIGHYWGNKGMWNNKIQDFIYDSYMNGLSIDEQIDKVKNTEFNKIPVNIKSSNTKKRLNNTISKIFPDKYAVYIPNK